MKDNFDETTAKRNKVSNRTIQFFLKRFFDVVISLLILIALSPIFLLIALWIIIDDGFPVFYKQKRSGINNTGLQMYKFRSMKNKQVPVPSNTHPYDEWNDGVQMTLSLNCRQRIIQTLPVLVDLFGSTVWMNFHSLLMF